MLEIRPPLEAEPESALFSWARAAKESSVASPAFHWASSSSAWALASAFCSSVASEAPSPVSG